MLPDGCSAQGNKTVSVVRAADNAFAGKGLLYMSPDSEDDKTIIRGYNTKFKSEIGTKAQIMLPKSMAFATAEIVDVIDDTTLKIKKAFGSESVTKLFVEAGQRIQLGSLGFDETKDVKEKGITYKIIPHVDQTKVIFSFLRQPRALTDFSQCTRCTRKFTRK